MCEFMKVEWKTFKSSFPYIYNNCGELSSLKREFCELCGKKDSLRKIEKVDYKKTIENSKLEETFNKAKKGLRKDKNNLWKKKKK